MDINFDSTGGTGSVTYGLRCNGTVSFSTSATWIKNMRYGSGELTFTIDGNTVSSERTGTITPSVNNTPCPGKTITVKQGGGSACVSSVTRTYGTGQANVGSCGGNVSVSIPYTSTTTWSGTGCPPSSTSTGQTTTAVTVSKNCENTEKIITGNNYRITQAAGPCSTCNCTAYRYETRYPNSDMTFDNCGGNEILSVTVTRQCVSPQSEEYEDYTQHTVYWNIDGDSGITLSSTQGTAVTLHADSNCTEDSRGAVIGLSAYTDDNEELVIGTINVTQEPGKCSTCECPESVVTSGDSGVTYFSIRKINIGEIDGSDSIGCSGGTVTVSGASIGVNDYDKYYILSSITYDCHDTITDITTSRKMLEDSVKEPIALPISSYTINSINCGESSSNTLDYVYEYRDENNNLSSITTSFTVNQVCECEEECDEYKYSIGHNSVLNFDDCGNHLVFNYDYSLDGHPITSITTDGTSTRASVYSASYSCVTKDEGRVSYTPKVVWELDGGESRYAILNGDTQITSVTGKSVDVSVNAEFNGEKYQNINLYVYGYGKDSEKIIYSSNCLVHRDKFCIPGECHKCELNVNFNGLNGSTIHRGERFTVSGTSMICSFVKSGNNGDVDSKLIWDPVILSISPSGYVEMSNLVHDDNTSGFSFDVSLSNTCPSSLNGLELTVSQSGETDCHESVTFNVECEGSTACPQWNIVPNEHSLPSSGGVVIFQACEDQMEICTENGTFTLTPDTGYAPMTENNSQINFSANTSFDPITYKVNYEDESGCTAEEIKFVVAGKPHEYSVYFKYYAREDGQYVEGTHSMNTGFQLRDFTVDGVLVTDGFRYEVIASIDTYGNVGSTSYVCGVVTSETKTYTSEQGFTFYDNNGTEHCKGQGIRIKSFRIYYNNVNIYSSKINSKYEQRDEVDGNYTYNCDLPNGTINWEF